MSRQSGFSYAEVLIAVTLLAVSLVPAVEALQTGLLGSQIHEELATDHYHLTGLLEDVLARPFTALEAEADAVGSPTTATSYSDPGGAPSRRLVYLARYDGDDADADGNPFTGVDPDLLWVRVEIEASTLDVVTLTTP